MTLVTPSPQQDVNARDRFARTQRCPVCGGRDEDPRGQGKRCHGFYSADRTWAYCARADKSSNVSYFEGSQTYAHWLAGECPCGVRHDAAPSSNGHAHANGRSHAEERGAIVAVYSYRDESGTELFQAVRYDPKGFSQRRPDGHGGYVWNIEDVRRVLYRLPELLEADPQVTVFVVEGEKDVDHLRALGLVATTNPMGVGKWLVVYSEMLRNRHVVIIPDNDQKGHDHAAYVLSSLREMAATVKIVELPGLPDKGDVSDWLDAGGTRDELQRLVEGTPQTNPDDVPSFPVESLPPAFRAFVEEGAASIVCAPDFLGVPLIGAAGAAIGNAMELELKPFDWLEGSNIWAAFVADPGGKKSPPLKAATRPIFHVQKERHERFKEDLEDYKTHLAQWEGEKKSGRGPPPEAPIYPHIVTTDTTTEAVVTIMVGAKGILLSKDELSGWVKSMDQYHAGGKGADRQHFMSMWSRSPIKVDRRGNPIPLFVPQPHLSVVGGIQPDLLADLADSKGREDGFLDRFLWSYPDEVTDHWETATTTAETYKAVEAIFERLYALDGPTTVVLSAKAKDLWALWYAENVAERLSDDLPRRLKGPWAKMPSQLARIALILHAVKDPHVRELSGETLAEAAHLIDYFKGHARRVYKCLAEHQQDGKIVLLSKLKTMGPLTKTDIVRKAFNCHTKSAVIQEWLEELEDAGLVHCQERPSKSGPASKVWAHV